MRLVKNILIILWSVSTLWIPLGATNVSFPAHPITPSHPYFSELSVSGDEKVEFVWDEEGEELKENEEDGNDKSFFSFSKIKSGIKLGFLPPIQSNEAAYIHILPFVHTRSLIQCVHTSLPFLHHRTPLFIRIRNLRH